LYHEIEKERKNIYGARSELNLANNGEIRKRQAKHPTIDGLILPVR